MSDRNALPPKRSPEVDAFLQKTPGVLDKYKDGVLRELSVPPPPYLIAALKAADAAINPPDLGGTSLADWNVRLKDATAIIRAALKAAGEA